MSKATAVRIIYFLVFCCTGAWLPKLYDYCMYNGLSVSQAALILSITPVMMFAVQPVYGFMADKLGYKKTLLISTFLASVSYLGFLVVDGYSLLIVVTIFMSVFYNTIQPVLDSLALQIAKDNPKFSYGSLRFYGAAGFAFTTIITGQIIDAVDITVIFIVSAITMFLAFGFCFFCKMKNMRKWRLLLIVMFGVWLKTVRCCSYYSAYSWFRWGQRLSGISIPLI